MAPFVLVDGPRRVELTAAMVEEAALRLRVPRTGLPGERMVTVRGALWPALGLLRNASGLDLEGMHPEAACHVLGQLGFATARLSAE